MKQFIAVNHPEITINVPALKQEALMFDQIAIPFLNAFLSLKQEEVKEAKIFDLKRLRQHFL